ncbi:MerC domain-containing protein [Niastella populi]|uniref:DUF2892 domain-containing protein n=1 Tax=Niastella populi TaxID=550983 RepID=A0A1V9EWK3_9BACT|nr:MerC domain-containing protein [Niastella populi]OQP50244.1 hypothetical protein A4R26_29910 [Niastella populi]
MKDRVRRNSATEQNMNIDNEIREKITQYASLDKVAITNRIKQLDEEWDIERVLEVNMSSIALTGVALSAFHHRRWLVLPAIVLGFFAQHAIQGWCPPLPLFRRLGYRTRAEIDKEKYALKVLRGDFNEVGGAGEKNSEAVFAAVTRN